MENDFAKKDIFTWFLCAGGCKRKIRCKKEESYELKSVGASWSCIRCLLNKKDGYTGAHYKGDKAESQMGSETAQVDEEQDRFLELLQKVQGRRLDNQRCQFPVNKTRVSSPSVEETSPSVEETSPTVEETSPSVEETSPTVEETSPKAEETSPTVEETSPSVEETSPSVEETSPPVEETSPTVEETSPAVEETSRTVEETPPTVEETSPAVEETSQTVEETSPTVEENLKVEEQCSNGSSPMSETASQESRGGSPNESEALDLKNVELHLGAFNVIRTLGSGGFGHVELVTLKTDHARSFALKTMKRKHIFKWRYNKRMVREGKLMKEIDCPFIPRMFSTFQDSNSIYLVMEACLGGDLHTLLVHCGNFDDNQTRFYAGCVLLALEYLHARGIVHRDVKPENILLDSRGYAKLGDFGTAKMFQDKMRSDTGTPGYMAPEMFVEKLYDHTVDFWSLGVTLFQLLSGSRPFEAYDHARIVWGFDAVVFPASTITDDAEDLIKEISKVEVYERLGRKGVADIKHHKWFQGFAWDELESQQMAPPFDPQVTGPTDWHNFS